MNVSREDRIAINENRLAAKRARVFYPTSRDMLNRKSAVLRIMTFENLNAAARMRGDLLSGKLDEAATLAVKAMMRTALQMSRRNGESAKYTGCALHRI